MARFHMRKPEAGEQAGPQNGARRANSPLHLPCLFGPKDEMLESAPIGEDQNPAAIRAFRIPAIAEARNEISDTARVRLHRATERALAESRNNIAGWRAQRRGESGAARRNRQ